MNAWVLFIQDSLTSESVLSVLMNDGGEILEPLQCRDLSFLRQLENLPPLILIIPTERTHHTFISLPKLSTQKARQAIEFSLEPRLAELLENNHTGFFFNESLQSYEVITLHKAYLHQLLHTFHSLGLYPQAIYSESSLLDMNEGLMIRGRYVLKSPEITGALIQGFEAHHLPQLQAVTVRCEQLPSAPFETLTYIVNNSPVEIWLAARAIRLPPLNLAENEFSPPKKQKVLFKYSLKSICIMLCFFWFLNDIFFSGLEYHMQHQKLIELNQQLESIEKNMFSPSMQHASPKIQLTRLLKKRDALIAPFWPSIILFEARNIPIDSLRYEHENLILSFNLPDFKQLLELKKQLQKQRLRIKQKEAKQQQKFIHVTLELSL